MSLRLPPKTLSYLAVLLPVLVVDRLSKVLVVDSLPVATPRDIAGSTLRFTLLYNRDAAMNITLGPWSRWGFATIAVIGVAVLLRLLHRAGANDRLRAVALGAISAGALGNLIDRLLSDRGVIDFIDVGIGSHRFWTFNVADIGVTLGALLLGYLYSRDERTVTP